MTRKEKTGDNQRREKGWVLLGVKDMKTGLLLSVARVVVIGTVVGGAAEVWAACTTTPNCESLGYQYCASECPNGSVACPFDSNKRFCFSPKPYTVSASTCSSQCKNGGSQSCTRGGVTYYNACGSSKCKSGEECKNGSCVSTCTYTVTKASCASQCKNVGTKSCKRGNTTYYESCGASKCSSKQTCSNGTCGDRLIPASGYCCDTTESYCIGYAYCWHEVHCDDMQASCRAQGGTPRFQNCYFYTSYYDRSYAEFSCE